jgi:hypothetical protein
VGASLYEAEIAEWRIGNRPLSLDGYPLVGPTGIDGLWLLTGTYREGFHCAPVLGPHLARMVLGLESTDVDPRFSPARPFLDPATPEESAHAYARHAASGALEHGARLPSFLGVDDLAAAARVRAMEVVEWLDLPVGLAPELVDAVLCSPDPRATATSLGGAARRLLAAHGNGLTSASTSKSDTIAGVTA